MLYSYRDRKVKKRTFRSLWISRINAGSKLYGLSYSILINKLKTKGIILNRKILADLAMNEPKAFKALIEKVR